MSILKHRLLGSGVNLEDLEAYEGDYGAEEARLAKLAQAPTISGQPGPEMTVDEELAINPNTGEALVEAPMLNSTRFAKLQGLMPRIEEDNYMSNARLAQLGMQGGVIPEETPIAPAVPSVDQGPSPEALVQAAQPSAIGSMLASMGSSPNRQSMVDAAQAERRAALQRADIERIGESLRAGLSSAQGINKYDPSDEQAKRIEKLGDLSMTELKEDMTLKPEEEMQDPNSAVSAQYRELAKKLLGENVPEGVSAAQLQSALPMLQQVAAGRKEDKKLALERQKLENKYTQGMSKLDQAIEKERRLLDMKEERDIKKENRKERRELDTADSALESQLVMLEKAKKELVKYGRSSLGGTGPIATLGGTTKYFSEDTQKLGALFGKISLDTMVKMFAGMSKAVDSDAERRAFDATQPSLSNDDEVNMMLIDDAIEATKNLMIKTKRAKNNFDRTGDFRVEEEAQTEQTSTGPYGLEVERTNKDGETAPYVWNPKVGKYQLK